VSAGLAVSLLGGHPAPSTPEVTPRAHRSSRRLALRIHAAFSAALVSSQVVIWAATGAGYFWPGWVLAGWGLLLALDAWDVLLRRPVTEADIDH
jgi:hypothetical protein